MAAIAPLADAGQPVAEVLRRLREETRRWVRRELERPRLDAGVPELNRVLGGGWPLGKVGELVGPDSSGRTTAAMAAVAAATGRGEVAAWIDPGDAFDPPSAQAAGVELQRLLWVRVRGVEGVVRAAEVVLEVGGFPLVVVDLVGVGGGQGRQGGRGAGRGASPGSLRLRLARAAERAHAVALVLAGHPWAGSLAGAVVRLAGRGGRWGGGEGGSPVWLEGVALQGASEEAEGAEGGAG